MHRLSRFALLMKGLPRDSFQKLVDLHDADRYVKKFGCWQQLLAMVYGQVAASSSLRELEAGFNQHRNHHYHLHAVEVHRSTLSNANDRRDPKVFEQTARWLIQRAMQGLGRKDAKQLLYLIDSTTIPLYARGSQWAKVNKTRTQGLKVHVQLQSDSALPVHFEITHANVNDETIGRGIEPQCGATYVFDKGYCNYGWWERIAAGGARFVTRLKKNAAITVVSHCEVPPQDTNVLSDRVIRLAKQSNRGGHNNACTRLLRRVEVARENEASLVLVSNDLNASAAEIADLYRQRWEVELFFKWIKQHLKIKKFLGESENAVRIQLLTALIAYLLVALEKTVTRFTGTLCEFLTELRTGLFVRAQEEDERWKRERYRQAVSDALQPGLFT